MAMQDIDIRRVTGENTLKEKNILMSEAILEAVQNDFFRIAELAKNGHIYVDSFAQYDDFRESRVTMIDKNSGKNFDVNLEYKINTNPVSA